MGACAHAYRRACVNVYIIHIFSGFVTNTVIAPKCTIHTHSAIDTSFRDVYARIHLQCIHVGTEPVQLMSREWNINDYADGVHTVSGLGVVGQLPKIEPGNTYAHT